MHFKNNPILSAETDEQNTSIFYQYNQDLELCSVIQKSNFKLEFKNLLVSM